MLILTDNTRQVDSRTVYQVQTDSRISAANVPAGTLGGWVDSIDHVRNGWLDENSLLVGDNAALRNGAVVIGSTILDSVVDGGTVTQSSLINSHVTRAEVTSSRVTESTILGQSGGKTADLTIGGGSAIHDSRIDGAGLVNHSQISHSTVTGEYFIDGSDVRDTLVFGESRLVKATVNNEYVKDSEIVPHAAGCDGNCYRLDGRC